MEEAQKLNNIVHGCDNIVRDLPSLIFALDGDGADTTTTAVFVNCHKGTGRYHDRNFLNIAIRGTFCKNGNLLPRCAPALLLQISDLKSMSVVIQKIESAIQDAISYHNHLEDFQLPLTKFCNNCAALLTPLRKS